MPTVDRRLNYLQSWWVPSDPMRRHPTLQLIGTHPGGGQYDCLTVVMTTEGDEGIIDLNRAGSLHVLRFRQGVNREHAHTIGRREVPLSWEFERSQNDRRLVVRMLEGETGLSAPSQTPLTTRRTLVFRIFYQVLLLTLNSPSWWDVRNGVLDSSGAFPGDRDPLPSLKGFDEAKRAATVERPDDVLGNPLYRFWLVLRDNDCRAVVDTDAMLYRSKREPIDIMAKFNEFNRSIEMTAAWFHQLVK